MFVFLAQILSPFLFLSMQKLKKFLTIFANFLQIIWNDLTRKCKIFIFFYFMYVYVIKKKNLLSIKVYFKNEAISKMQQPRFARASMIKFDVFYLFYFVESKSYNLSNNVLSHSLPIIFQHLFHRCISFSPSPIFQSIEIISLLINFFINK